MSDEAVKLICECVRAVAACWVGVVAMRVMAALYVKSTAVRARLEEIKALSQGFK